ncbi:MULTISPECIES: hypothetical protein [Streptomycetaceae]|uniref:hypothetical protein n=1 Tax=Streptomycetaceae TaxID=2062 RepID=UPI000370E553|nr:hypothetical protein [Streptomyces sp. BoleA5]MDX2853687.1 hypothetical protein [Streptomyces sp. PA03-3a]MYX37331.1 hypothetical protein [Streptomyces sp. SID8377]
MLDCTTLRDAAGLLAARYRSLPQSRLRGEVARAGLELARELAARAQRIEFPGREPLTMPDEGVFAIGDQISVAAHDLAAALEPHPELAHERDAAVSRIRDTAARCGL